jgi:hypothetical protein
MNWNLLRASLGGLLIAVLASGCFESQWENEVASSPSAFKVSATKLGKAFDSDKSSAKQRY